MKSFEERLERLEQISQQIRDGEIPLEKAAELFEEGVTLARGLEKELVLELFPELSDIADADSDAE